MAFSLALGVTPELLKAKSGDVYEDINAMRSDIKIMYEEVMSTSSYWAGEAGNAQRKLFEEDIEKVNQMLNRLDTYPERIMKMAGIYEQAEEIGKTIANSMKTDIEMI